MQTRYQIEYEQLTPWGDPLMLYLTTDEHGIQVFDEGVYASYLFGLDPVLQRRAVEILHHVGLQVSPEGLHGRYPLIIEHILEQPLILQRITEAIVRVLWLESVDADEGAA